MCEAHIQDAPDDIPQSESDVVTPEEERSKRENPDVESGNRLKNNNQYLMYWLLFESNDIVWSAI